MTTRSDVPFNVSLLDLTPQKLQGLIPVKVLDIFERPGSNNFHDEGLFSTVIFGKPGDDRRNYRFSYIDIKIPIFHPVIYRTLLSLKHLYTGILSGQEYAVWNDLIKDFERSDSVNGKTGFYFFLEHWKDIDFPVNKSDQREQNVLLIKKYKDRATTNKIIVMPAGLRDLEILPGGRFDEDEINVFYRKLLALSNTIVEANIRHSPEMLNTVRYSLQMTFNELYSNLESRVEGKKKLLMGKFASRKIFNGTRNVITAMDTSSPYLGAPGSIHFNSTIVGLYQQMKSIMPVARYMIRNGFLSKVFISVDQPVRLVDKKTLKRTEVKLSSQYFDRWMTNEGVEKVITAFQDEALRDKPLEIEDHYMGLLYRGPDGTFKLIQDIDEVPASRNKKDVVPMTFCHLLYLSCYTKLNKFPCFVTRYPVTGTGSIFPSFPHTKTTTHTEVRRELDDYWQPMDDEHVAYEFPIGGPYIDSMTPHSAKLARLGADRTVLF